MDVLPAIDIRNGKVVRLRQGDYDQQTVYSETPSAVARTFAEAGAEWIHVVDLDAALTGKPTNTEAIRDICRSVDVKVELGGGARDEQTIDSMLAMGIDRVVVGSAAMRDWGWFETIVARSDLAGRLALGLDARGDKVAAQGWTEQLETTAIDLSRRTMGWPLGAIVYTDIARDGILAGVNIAATAAVAAATDVQVIASGGVSAINDIYRCKEIGCGGVIIGRAYYEGKINLVDALRVAES